MPKIMIALNTTWNLVNFRANLIKSILANGYDVFAIAPPDEYVERLCELGCEYVPINIDNKGTNFFEDLKLCFRVFKILKKCRPDVLITYTIKPNIYFSLVAHLLNIPVINTVTGLGSAYLQENIMTHLLDFLYKLAFTRSRKVFFQNQDDLNLFTSKKIVSLKKTERVYGSGVDLKKFQPELKSRPVGYVFQFLFVGRIIADKGIFEFLQAISILKEGGYHFKACILGFLEVENPGAISVKQMNAWVSKGLVEYLGAAEDVRPYLKAADCVVLPSYREGISKTLLEACAMAKPIITTDTVGCRDLVEEGRNGYLCEVKSPDNLAEKMKIILKKDWNCLDKMGDFGRQKIAKQYDEQKVIRQYIDSINAIFHDAS